MLPALLTDLPRRPPRVFFFDCGASLYSSGSGGASQSWFVQGYATSGLPFDRVLAWEFTNHTDAEILAPLPSNLRGGTAIYRNPEDARPGCCTRDRLSYHNFGIDAIAGSLRNPLTHLRALATPDDFVAFKLDVDAPAIEIALVEQLLSDAATASLIDDFFWEDVVEGSMMGRFGWNHDLRKMPSASRRTMSDSYRLFLRLRRMGIRAHAWV